MTPTLLPALALALALSTSPGENPADLAARLASADPSTREAAEGDLEEIGRPALPALRIALGRSEDGSASRRLIDLIERIERRRLLRATPVGPIVAGRPIAETLAEIGRVADCRPTLDRADAPVVATPRGGPADSSPAPFWEALDRLGLRPEPPSKTDRRSPPEVSPAVRLVREAGEVDAPRARFVGPYRVDLMAIDRHRRVVRAAAGAAPRVVDEVTATLRVVAEPGIGLDRNGRVRLLEAVDDRGGDLLAPQGPPPPSSGPATTGLDGSGLGQVSFAVALGPPSGPGGTIRRLRGDLPVIALARSGPLLTVPLAGAEKQGFVAGGITLTVRRANLFPGRLGVIQMTVRGERPPGPAIAPGPRRLTLLPVVPSFQVEEHVQVVDERGRPFALSGGSAIAGPDGSLQFQATVIPRAGLGTPTTLRYYGVVAEATEIPFSFEGVPMP